MTNDEIRKCRLLIKENILHYLCDDWNNHKRGRAHKENVALYDKHNGYAMWNRIELEDIMEKVVNGIWSADLESLLDKEN